jgi:hypothetical protein
MPLDVCSDCGEPGHKSKRSKACCENNSKEKILDAKLGNKHEIFTRKVYLSSVLKRKYRDLFTRNVIKLSGFIRNVVFRAQIFINTYVIEHKEEYTHSSLFDNNFWYSICQMVMCKRVTNNTTISSEMATFFDDSKRRHPNIIYPLESNNITGYSDSLAAACELLKTTYLNHITEKFHIRIQYYLFLKFQRIFEVVSNQFSCLQ